MHHDGRIILKYVYCLASALTGIEFEDNGVQKYLTEDNGVAVARTQVLFIEDHSYSYR